MTTTVPHSLFERHRRTIETALAAIRSRTCWNAYPEVPSGKVYGDTARDEGKAAFEQRLNRAFLIDQPGQAGAVGEEVSPYGMPLGIKYPKVDVHELVAASRRGMRFWAKAETETRLGICLEILHRLNRRSFEIAFSVMHTTGQGFMMAFQAGGPHAQDRGLEALAYACELLRSVPAEVRWEKQVSKTDAIALDKTYRIVPRGVAAVIGCSTFPTWNTYPGLFASLVTGNAVIVKPHPGAILPLAITVEIGREVLREEGFDPNLLSLAADAHSDPITRELVTHPEIAIVDYTGSSEFGQWIEAHARQAVVFTEKAGVNSVIIESVNDLDAVAANLAFTLCLYSAQMCTTPQNIFIPRDGIAAGAGHRTFDQVAGAIVEAVDRLLADPKRASEVLGAIQSEKTLQRVEEAARERGVSVLRQSQPVGNEMFPKARVRSPLILKVEAAQPALFMREMFGPITYIVATNSAQHSLALASETARTLGAITWSAYSMKGGALNAIEEAAADAGVSLSCNLTGPIYVNQAAAFSDFHVSGCNPSGNATLTDAAFVAPRFRIVQSRRPAATQAKPEPALAVARTGA